MLKIIIFISLTFIILSSGQKYKECDAADSKKCNFGLVPDDDIGKIARAADYNHRLEHDPKNIRIPETFDARTHWPECRQVISRIKDQGDCSNCWAYCSTMVLADRLCIANKGAKGTNDTDFSIVDLTNCCTNCLGAPAEPPCEDGGRLSKSFLHSVQNGVAFEECKPYDLDRLMKQPPRCENKCANRKFSYKKSVYKFDKAYWLYDHPDPKVIQIDIMTHGPICGSIENMTMEFMRWNKKTVFNPKLPIPKPKERYGHAIRIIGWGTESGIDYWLIANSWGTSWGDEGTIKISRSVKDNVFAITRMFYMARTTALKEGASFGSSSVPSAVINLSLIIFLFLSIHYVIVYPFIVN